MLNKLELYYELSKVFLAFIGTIIVTILVEPLREIWYLYLLTICGTFFFLDSFFSKEKEKIEIIISCIIITIGIIITYTNRTNDDTIFVTLFSTFFTSTIIASLFFLSKVFSQYRINSI